MYPIVNFILYIPYFSLPGLYWSYTNKTIVFDGQGEMLIKSVCNSKISSNGNGPSDQIIYFKKPKLNKGIVFNKTQNRN
jgi:hypothetical protein